MKKKINLGDVGYVILSPVPHLSVLAFVIIAACTVEKWLPVLYIYIYIYWCMLL